MGGIVCCVVGWAAAHRLRTDQWLDRAHVPSCMRTANGSEAIKAPMGDARWGRKVRESTRECAVPSYHLYPGRDC